MTVHTEDLSDGIRLLTLTGSMASQSFSRASLPVIANAINDALGDSNIKGLVITGEGRFFSAGADINAFQASIEANEAPQLIRDLTNILHPLIVKMRQSPTITVAAVNGAAAGGGLGLALACDARIASPKAKFAAAYASMGLSPDGGTTWLLPRLVGEQVARKFFLQNEIWTAREARDLGAIDVLVSDDGALLETAIGLAKHWSQWGSHTKEATKHLLHVHADHDFETHLKHEQTLIEAAGITQEFKDGVQSFLKKK